jgi:hypothetical protein
MERSLILFKSWYGPLNVRQFIPYFKFSRNVQGWFYTRYWSIFWLTYCFSLDCTITSDFNEDNNIAHEKNVVKYFKK